MKESFQDQGSVAGCYGCGADNVKGLRLKSFWDGDDAVAYFVPSPEHCAGSPQIVYGGLLASLLDCHSCNFAIARHFKSENRGIGSEPKIYCVTAQLNVSFQKPTPLGVTLQLRASLISTEGRKTWVRSIVTANGNQTAYAEVLVVRVAGEMKP